MSVKSQKFTFIGNNIAIDFVNTVVASRGTLIDFLQDKSDFIVWTGVANLSIDSNKLDSQALERVLELRTALKNIFTAKIDSMPSQEKDLAIVNKNLCNHSTQQILDFEKGKYVLQAAQEALSLSALLGLLAYEGASLLASTHSYKIKKCNNKDCVLIFFDISRSQKRRWCSMDSCGNRSKVATHYKKNLG